MNERNHLPKAITLIVMASQTLLILSAYHIVLPWQWITLGLKLVFVDNKYSSELQADNINFLGSAQLVLHNIILGMLTEPPISDNHELTIEPVLYATDYFQTLSISKLIWTLYQKIQLNRVIVSSGIIYAQLSGDDGGVYKKGVG